MRRMLFSISILVLLLPGTAHPPACLADGPSAISYQGRLTDSSGNPVSGPQDLTFRLLSAQSGGTLLWYKLYSAVPVESGLFTVALGPLTPSALSYAEVWLEVQVDSAPPLPRVRLLAVPYALNNWSLTGNSGANPLFNFLGTTDSWPLELKVNGLRALRLEPHSTCPNLIGGSQGNYVTAGVAGATIGGGGEPGPANSVTDDFGTVGGGRLNRAGDDAGTTTNRSFATVSGGMNNTASGAYSVVGGGSGNAAGGEYSAVPGGYGNQVWSRFGFAAGRRAYVSHDGTFVWADSQDSPFWSTGANQFLIRASGGVGINTNSPTEKLHVAGGNALIGGPNDFVTNGDEARVNLGDANNYVRAVRGGGVRLGAFLAQDGIALAEWGNVGIGTTNPQSRLEVAGIVHSTSGGYKFPDGTIQTTAATGGGGIGGSGADNYVARWNGSSALESSGIYETDSGSVGIGTVSPAEKLHVASGNAVISGPSNFEVGTEAALILGDHNHQVRAVWGSGLRLGVDGAPDAVAVNGGGNVGIGTTNPQSRLEVAGTIHSTSDGYKFPDGTVQTTAATGGGIGGSGADNCIPRWNGSSALENSAIYQTDAGSVGIGTDWPSEKLHVASGNALIAGPSNFEPGTEAKLSLGDGNTYIRALWGEGLRFGVLGTDAMVLKENGTVGIGTIFPSHTLTVKSSIAGVMRLLGPGSFESQARLEFGDVNRVYIEEDADDKLTIFGQDRTAIMGGNVGIGMANPATKLQVAGDVTANDYYYYSDSRLKKNIQPLNAASETISRLRPVRFDWRRDEFPDRHFGDDGELGLIAQEVKDVLPEVVHKGSNGYYQMDYARLTPVLVQAVKELKAEKDAEVAQLRSENSDLRERLAALEKLVASLTGGK